MPYLQDLNGLPSMSSLLDLHSVNKEWDDINFNTILKCLNTKLQSSEVLI